MRRKINFNLRFLFLREMTAVYYTIILYTMSSGTPHGARLRFRRFRSPRARSPRTTTVTRARIRRTVIRIPRPSPNLSFDVAITVREARSVLSPNVRNVPWRAADYRTLLPRMTCITVSNTPLTIYYTVNDCRYMTRSDIA